MAKIQQIVEKAIKREEAISSLLQMGVLVNFDSSINLFHGRVNTKNNNFAVKSNFNNAGSALGHNNNNSIPGLHASSFEVAKKYAEKRFVEHMEKNKEQGKVEVHKIFPVQTGTMIFNSQKLFDMEELKPYLENVFKISTEEIENIEKSILTQEEKEKVCQAVKDISSFYDITSLMPELFNKKESVKILKGLQEICSENEKTKAPFVFDDDLEKFVQKNASKKMPEELIRSISGALNVYQMLTKQGDIKTLISKFQSDLDFTKDCTLNLKCFRAFLEKEQIVGIKQKLWVSNIINQNNFDDYFFFDTAKVNTKKIVKKMSREKTQGTNNKNKTPVIFGE